MMDFSDLAASRSVAVAEAVGRLALTSGTALRPFLPHSPHAMRRWLAVAAFVTISGCSSWFGSDVQQPARQASQASADAAAAKSAGTETATDGSAGAAATSAAATNAAATSGAMPDINSVPTNAPVPQDVNLEGVQPGLAADRTNAQYTDETLVSPSQSVARPAAPAPVQPAPAQQSAAAGVAPTPTAIPAPQSPGVSQQPLAAPAQPGQYQAPQLAPSGQVFQGYAGTPQPGSKPLGGSVAPTGAGSVMVDYSSVSAGGTYGYASYGGYQRINPAQAQYRSPYGAPQVAGYGMPAYQPVLAPAIQSGFQPYGQPVAVPPLPAGGQPVGIVFFNNGSARLSGDDSRVVKQVAEMHRYYGGVIRVVGHASQRTGNMDPYAQQQVNYKVSMERANSIARALTRAGVPASLVQVAAAGSANPVALETMPAGEANNRRAEIFLSAY